MSIQFTLVGWGLVTNYTNQAATAVKAVSGAAVFVGGQWSKKQKV